MKKHHRWKQSSLASDKGTKNHEELLLFIIEVRKLSRSDVLFMAKTPASVFNAINSVFLLLADPNVISHSDSICSIELLEDYIKCLSRAGPKLMLQQKTTAIIVGETLESLIKLTKALLHASVCSISLKSSTKKGTNGTSDLIDKDDDDTTSSPIEYCPPRKKTRQEKQNLPRDSKSIPNFPKSTNFPKTSNFPKSSTGRLLCILEICCGLHTTLRQHAATRASAAAAAIFSPLGMHLPKHCQLTPKAQQNIRKAMRDLSHTKLSTSIQPSHLQQKFPLEKTNIKYVHSTNDTPFHDKTGALKDKIQNQSEEWFQLLHATTYVGSNSEMNTLPEMSSTSNMGESKISRPNKYGVLSSNKEQSMSNVSGAPRNMHEIGSLHMINNFNSNEVLNIIQIMIHPYICTTQVPASETSHSKRKYRQIKTDQSSENRRGVKRPRNIRSSGRKSRFSDKNETTEKKSFLRTSEDVSNLKNTLKGISRILKIFTHAMTISNAPLQNFSNTFESGRLILDKLLLALTQCAMNSDCGTTSNSLQEIIFEMTNYGVNNTTFTSGKITKLEMNDLDKEFAHVISNICAYAAYRQRNLLRNIKCYTCYKLIRATITTDDTIKASIKAASTGSISLNGEVNLFKIEENRLISTSRPHLYKLVVNMIKEATSLVTDMPNISNHIDSVRNIHESYFNHDQSFILLLGKVSLDARCFQSQDEFLGKISSFVNTNTNQPYNILDWILQGAVASCVAALIESSKLYKMLENEQGDDLVQSTKRSSGSKTRTRHLPASSSVNSPPSKRAKHSKNTAGSATGLSYKQYSRMSESPERRKYVSGLISPPRVKTMRQLRKFISTAISLRTTELWKAAKHLLGLLLTLLEEHVSILEMSRLIRDKFTTEHINYILILYKLVEGSNVTELTGKENPEILVIHQNLHRIVMHLTSFCMTPALETHLCHTICGSPMHIIFEKDQMLWPLRNLHRGSLSFLVRVILNRLTRDQKETNDLLMTKFTPNTSRGVNSSIAERLISTLWLAFASKVSDALSSSTGKYDDEYDVSNNISNLDLDPELMCVLFYFLPQCDTNSMFKILEILIKSLKSSSILEASSKIAWSCRTPGEILLITRIIQSIVNICMHIEQNNQNDTSESMNNRFNLLDRIFSKSCEAKVDLLKAIQKLLNDDLRSLSSSEEKYSNINSLQNFCKRLGNITSECEFDWLLRQASKSDTLRSVFRNNGKKIEMNLASVLLSSLNVFSNTRRKESSCDIKDYSIKKAVTSYFFTTCSRLFGLVVEVNRKDSSHYVRSSVSQLHPPEALMSLPWILSRIAQNNTDATAGSAKGLRSSVDRVITLISSISKHVAHSASCPGSEDLSTTFYKHCITGDICLGLLHYAVVADEVHNTSPLKDGIVVPLVRNLQVIIEAFVSATHHQISFQVCKALGDNAKTHKDLIFSIMRAGITEKGFRSFLEEIFSDDQTQNMTDRATLIEDLVQLNCWRPLKDPNSKNQSENSVHTSSGLLTAFEHNSKCCSFASTVNKISTFHIFSQYSYESGFGMLIESTQRIVILATRLLLLIARKIYNCGTKNNAKFRALFSANFLGHLAEITTDRHFPQAQSLASQLILALIPSPSKRNELIVQRKIQSWHSVLEIPKANELQLSHMRICISEALTYFKIAMLELSEGKPHIFDGAVIMAEFYTGTSELKFLLRRLLQIICDCKDDSAKASQTLSIELLHILTTASLRSRPRTKSIWYSLGKYTPSTTMSLSRNIVNRPMRSQIQTRSGIENTIRKSIAIGLQSDTIIWLTNLEFCVLEEFLVILLILAGANGGKANTVSSNTSLQCLSMLISSTASSEYSQLNYLQKKLEMRVFQAMLNIAPGGQSSTTIKLINSTDGNSRNDVAISYYWHLICLAAAHPKKAGNVLVAFSKGLETLIDDFGHDNSIYLSKQDISVTGKFQTLLCILQLCQCLLQSPPISNSNIDKAADKTFFNEMQIETSLFSWDTSQQNDIQKSDQVCSYELYGSRFVVQPWYYCYTCDLTGKKGCCSVCARTCHKGHDVVFSRLSRFFCDCGPQGCCTSVSAGCRTGSSRISPNLASSKPLTSGRGKTRAQSPRNVPFFSVAGGNKGMKQDLHDVHCPVIVANMPKIKLSVSELQTLRLTAMENGFPQIILKSMQKLKYYMLMIMRSSPCDISDIVEEECHHGTKFAASPPDLLLAKKNTTKGKENSDEYYSFQSNSQFQYHISTIRNTFEVKRSSGSKRKSTEVKRLISTDSRGRAAVSENNNVSVINIMPLVQNAVLSRYHKNQSNQRFLTRNDFKTLSKTKFGFAITQLLFHPLCDNILCVAGEQDCIVLLLTDTGEIERKLVVQLNMEPETSIIRLLWIPDSVGMSEKSTQLVVIADTFLKIYDLSNDYISSLHQFKVPTAGWLIRDVAFAPAVFSVTQGDGNNTSESHSFNCMIHPPTLFIATSSQLFVQSLENLKNKNTSASTFFRQTLDVPANIQGSLGCNAALPFSSIHFVKNHSNMSFSGATSSRDIHIASDSSAKMNDNGGVLFFSYENNQTGILKLSSNLCTVKEIISFPISELVGVSTDDRTNTRRDVTRGSQKSKKNMKYSSDDDSLVPLPVFDGCQSGKCHMWLDFVDPDKNSGKYPTALCVTETNKTGNLSYAAVGIQLRQNCAHLNILSHKQPKIQIQDLKTRIVGLCVAPSMKHLDYTGTASSAAVLNLLHPRPVVLVLLEDGSLRSFREGGMETVPLPMYPKVKDSRKNNSDSRSQLENPEIPLKFPIDFFEKCIRVSRCKLFSPEFSIGGDIARLHSTDKAQWRIMTPSDDHIISPRTANFSIVVTSCSPDLVICGLRLLVGQSSKNVPRSISIAGRLITAGKPRWYDLPLTNLEQLNALREGAVVVDLGPSTVTGSPSAVRCVEVFARPKIELLDYTDLLKSGQNTNMSTEKDLPRDGKYKKNDTIFCKNVVCLLRRCMSSGVQLIHAILPWTKIEEKQFAKHTTRSSSIIWNKSTAIDHEENDILLHKMVKAVIPLLATNLSRFEDSRQSLNDQTYLEQYIRSMCRSQKKITTLIAKERLLHLLQIWMYWQENSPKQISASLINRFLIVVRQSYTSLPFRDLYDIQNALPLLNNCILNLYESALSPMRPDLCELDCWTSSTPHHRFQLQSLLINVMSLVLFCLASVKTKTIQSGTQLVNTKLARIKSKPSNELFKESIMSNIMSLLCSPILDIRGFTAISIMSTVDSLFMKPMKKNVRKDQHIAKCRICCRVIKQRVKWQCTICPKHVVCENCYLSFETDRSNNSHNWDHKMKCVRMEIPKSVLKKLKNIDEANKYDGLISAGTTLFYTLLRQLPRLLLGENIHASPILQKDQKNIRGCLRAVPYMKAILTLATIARPSFPNSQNCRFPLAKPLYLTYVDILGDIAATWGVAEDREIVLLLTTSMTYLINLAPQEILGGAHSSEIMDEDDINEGGEQIMNLLFPWIKAMFKLFKEDTLYHTKNIPKQPAWKEELSPLDEKSSQKHAENIEQKKSVEGSATLFKTMCGPSVSGMMFSLWTPFFSKNDLQWTRGNPEINISRLPELIISAILDCGIALYSNMDIQILTTGTREQWKPLLLNYINSKVFSFAKNKAKFLLLLMLQGDRSALYIELDRARFVPSLQILWTVRANCGGDYNIISYKDKMCIIHALGELINAAANPDRMPNWRISAHQRMRSMIYGTRSSSLRSSLNNRFVPSDSMTITPFKLLYEILRGLSNVQEVCEYVLKLMVLAVPKLPQYNTFQVEKTEIALLADDQTCKQIVAAMDLLVTNECAALTHIVDAYILNSPHDLIRANALQLYQNIWIAGCYRPFGGSAWQPIMTKQIYKRFPDIACSGARGAQFLYMLSGLYDSSRNIIDENKIESCNEAEEKNNESPVVRSKSLIRSSNRNLERRQKETETKSHKRTNHTESLTRALVGTLVHQLKAIKGIPNSLVYNSLQNFSKHKKIECYFDAAICNICLPKPQTEDKNLEDNVLKFRWTSNATLIQLDAPTLIHEVNVSARDVNPLMGTSRMPGHVQLFTHRGSSHSLADLRRQKDLWDEVCSSKWQHAETLHLKLSIPIIATHIMLQFSEFPVEGILSTPKVVCPRCSSTVTNKHGVCSSCGEVAFQCRSCRNINYENLDAFLCVECGYCRFARFSFKMKCSLPAWVAPIVDEMDMKRVTNLLESANKSAESCHNDLRKFSRVLQHIALLKLKSSSSGLGPLPMSMFVPNVQQLETSKSAKNASQTRQIVSSSQSSKYSIATANEAIDKFMCDIGGNKSNISADGRHHVGFKRAHISSSRRPHLHPAQRRTRIPRSSETTPHQIQHSMPRQSQVDNARVRIPSNSNSSSIPTSRERRLSTRHLGPGSSLSNVRNTSRVKITDSLVQTPTCSYMEKMEKLYSGPCQVAFRHLHRHQQISSACRQRLREFGQRMTHTTSTIKTQMAVRRDKNVKPCFCCAQEFIASAITLLKVMIQTSVHHEDFRAMSLQNLVTELMGVLSSSLYIVNGNIRSNVRYILLQISKINSDAATQICNLIGAKINTLLPYFRSTNIENNLHWEISLLENICLPGCRAEFVDFVISMISNISEKYSNDSLISDTILLPFIRILGRLCEAKHQLMNTTTSTPNMTCKRIATGIEEVLSQRWAEIKDETVNGTGQNEKLIWKSMSQIKSRSQVSRIIQVWKGLCSFSKRRTSKSRTKTTKNAKQIKVADEPLETTNTSKNLLKSQNMTKMAACLPKLLCISCSESIRIATADTIKRISLVNPLTIIDMLVNSLAEVVQDYERDSDYAADDIISLLLLICDKDKGISMYLKRRNVLSFLLKLMRREVIRIIRLESLGEPSSQIIDGRVLYGLSQFVEVLTQVDDGNSTLLRDEHLSVGVFVLMNIRALELRRTASIIDAERVIRKILLGSHEEAKSQKFVEKLLVALNRVISNVDTHILRNRVTLCCLREMCNAVNPIVSEPAFDILLQCSRSQEDFFRSSLPTNPISVSSILEGRRRDTEGGIDTIKDKEYISEGPTMSDLRSKIATDLDFTDATQLIELLVCGKLISLHLPVRHVYKLIWTPHAIELDTYEDNAPMVVTYRLVGVDGEATEEIVDKLKCTENSPTPKDAELKYLPTTVLRSCDGLQTLLKIIANTGQQEFKSQMQQDITFSVVKLLRYCCYMPENRRTLIKLQAADVLLQCLVESFASLQGEVAGSIAEELLLILESVLIEANALATQSVGFETSTSTSTTTSCSTNDSPRRSMRMLSPLHSSLSGNGKMPTSSHLGNFLEQLSSDEKCKALRSNSKLGRAMARILPYLTYGREMEVLQLVRHFEPWLNPWDYDKIGHTCERTKFHIGCFLHAMEILATGNQSFGQQLKDTLITQGVTGHLIAAISTSGTEALKTTEETPKTREWMEFTRKPSLALSLDLLSAVAKSHPETQQLVLDGGAVPIVHALVKSEIVGPKAEVLLEVLSAGKLNVAEAVAAIKEATIRKNKQLAALRRSRVLARMGLVLSPKKKNSSSTDTDKWGGGNQILATKECKWLDMLSDSDSEDEDTGPVCMVCQEGYRKRPDDVLCVYTYSKPVKFHSMLGRLKHTQYSKILRSDTTTRRSTSRKREANKNIGESSSVSQKDGMSDSSNEKFCATVSSFNAIHYFCHRKAVASESTNSGPGHCAKSEWEGAFLRNSHTKCNNLLPLRGGNISANEYERCIETYFKGINTNSISIPPDAHGRLRIIVHDIKILLLRFAFGEQLSEDTQGGGNESNFHLLLAQLYLGISVQKSHPNEKFKQRDLLAAYLHEPQRIWWQQTQQTDSAYYMTVLSLWILPLQEWHRHRVQFVRRMLINAVALRGDFHYGRGSIEWGSGARTRSRARSRSLSMDFEDKTNMSQPSGGSKSKGINPDDEDTEIVKPVVMFALLIDWLHSKLKNDDMQLSESSDISPQHSSKSTKNTKSPKGIKTTKVLRRSKRKTSPPRSTRNTLAESSAVSTYSRRRNFEEPLYQKLMNEVISLDDKGMSSQLLLFYEEQKKITQSGRDGVNKLLQALGLGTQRSELQKLRNMRNL